MEYSSAVRERFERPAAARGSVGGAALIVAASAGDRSLNVWVRFAVSVQDGALTGIEYNVYGCPHLIAVCDRAAEWLHGRDIAALRSLPLDALARELAVPREKHGKLLRLEDALNGCADELMCTMEPKGGER